MWSVGATSTNQPAQAPVVWCCINTKGSPGWEFKLLVMVGVGVTSIRRGYGGSGPVQVSVEGQVVVYDFPDEIVHPTDNHTGEARLNLKRKR